MDFTPPLATVNLPTSTSTDMGDDPSFSHHVNLDSTLGFPNTQHVGARGL